MWSKVAPGYFLGSRGIPKLLREATQVLDFATIIEFYGSVVFCWQNQDIERLTARVGIHAGNIVAGNIGGRNKIKYGASRLEQAKNQLEAYILMSRSVYVSLPKSINCTATDHGMIDIKGRAQQQHVYSM